MTQIKVILASASPRRKELLNQIGIIPEIIPGNLEEKVTSDVPSQVVEELSRQKAEHVWNTLEEDQKNKCVVIGSDTVVSVHGKILGKPKSMKEAEDMIRSLQDGKHQVYTGVTLVGCGRSVTFSEKTEVFVYPMTDKEIVDYVAAGESMDKAGAYGIQGRFAAFIERIEGSYTNVMGLPTGRVYKELKKLTEDIR